MADNRGDNNGRRETDGRCSDCMSVEFNKMQGATTIRDWLLRVMVLFVLGGGVYGVNINKATADTVSDLAIRVALTEQSVEELKRLAEKSLEYQQQHQDQHSKESDLNKEQAETMIEQNKEILKAIRTR
jgi:hypothetical protein